MEWDVQTEAGTVFEKCPLYPQGGLEWNHFGKGSSLCAKNQFHDPSRRASEKSDGDPLPSLVLLLGAIVTIEVGCMSP